MIETKPSKRRKPMIDMTGKPKSYMSAEEREKLFQEGGEKLVYLSETLGATRANDMETALAWMRLVEFSPKTLLGLKARAGAQFIREERLITTQADKAYGPGWLDRN
jgi:hypothetical protein